MLEREDLARQARLVGQQVALVAELEHDEDEVGSVEREFLLHDVPVLQLLHYFYLLVDVFLQEGFLLYLSLGDHLHCGELVAWF